MYFGRRVDQSYKQTRITQISLRWISRNIRHSFVIRPTWWHNGRCCVCTQTSGSTYNSALGWKGWLLLALAFNTIDGVRRLLLARQVLEKNWKSQVRARNRWFFAVRKESIQTGSWQQPKLRCFDCGHCWRKWERDGVIPSSTKLSVFIDSTFFLVILQSFCFYYERCFLLSGTRSHSE